MKKKNRKKNKGRKGEKNQNYASFPHPLLVTMKCFLVLNITCTLQIEKGSPFLNFAKVQRCKGKENTCICCSSNLYISSSSLPNPSPFFKKKQTEHARLVMCITNFAAARLYILSCLVCFCFCTVY